MISLSDIMVRKLTKNMRIVTNTPLLLYSPHSPLLKFAILKYN